ncbi:MAG: DUF1501 domain-containing protein [Cytophagaceae bacterium]|nr:DUF1501 domain-containing protein [Cytophagaceae bacterium]
MNRIDHHTEARFAEAHFNTRRHFLKQSTLGLGALALGSLVHGCQTKTAPIPPVEGATESLNPLAVRAPQFAPKAKRVLFLHMEGAPSQLELFDFKPALAKLDGQPCPQSLLEGKRFAFIKGVPNMLGPQAKFAQHGASGAWLSEYFEHFPKVVDQVSFLKALHTDEFNHAPAQLFMHTGSPRLGRPSMGSWVTYGLGSENQNLPGFVVLVSGADPSAGKSVWGPGFLPTVYQGVQCRAKGDPVLYINNPAGVDTALRKRSIEVINQINELEHQQLGDPEILSRISQYELAYRMQAEVPETMNIADEPTWVHEWYGAKPGEASFANNCLLARKLLEKGVRFVQLFDRSWDHHGTDAGSGVDKGLRGNVLRTDKPVTALLQDLEQRGLLDDTLVVWGGEFGRTPMMENRDGNVHSNFKGRDHHTEAFTMWLAGGGIKKGFSWGETDEIGYYGVQGKTHIHDLQATILHLLGFDHEHLTFPFQGRNFRLTDVHGKVVREILA